MPHWCIAMDRLLLGPARQTAMFRFRVAPQVGHLERLKWIMGQSEDEKRIHSSELRKLISWIHHTNSRMCETDAPKPDH